MLASAVHDPLGARVTSPRQDTERYDIVVVGAGPAGCAAAIALAKEDVSVLLVERSPFPRWKVCGACLGPGALASLDALGAGDRPELRRAIPLEHMVLHGYAKEARLRLEGWKALSRTVLDHALVQEAERAGVCFTSPTRAALGPVEGDTRSVRLTGSEAETDIRARIVIDATGLGHGLADAGRAANVAAPGARVGLGAVFDAPDYPIAPGELHMAIAPVGYVGLVRVEDGALNVAAALDADSLRAAPPAHLVDGVLVGAGLSPLPPDPLRGWRGTPALTRAVGDVGTDRLLRLGDAAGYVEPFTGEGIGWALGDGRAAAAVALGALGKSFPEALVEWREYRMLRRRNMERLCRALARGLRHPWMVSIGLSTVRAAPALAGPLVRRAARLDGARVHR